MTKPAKARWVLVLVAVILMMPARMARAQDRELRRGKYLQLLDLVEERQSVRDYLDEVLRASGETTPERLTGLFSFVMVIHGLDRRLVGRLHSGGVDVVHAMTSNARPFLEQGLFSDPVVLGDVIGLRNEEIPGDRYGSTIELRVVETFKGKAPPDTIFLRQRGTFEGGIRPHELEPREGEQYLFLLSRPMYEFFWATDGMRADASQEAVLPVSAPGQFFAIYRHYRVDDGRVVMGDGTSYEADRVFQELRWLQELIDTL